MYVKITDIFSRWLKWQSVGTKTPGRREACVHLGAVACCGQRTLALNLNLSAKLQHFPAMKLGKMLYMLLFIVYIHLLLIYSSNVY